MTRSRTDRGPTRVSPNAAERDREATADLSTPLGVYLRDIGREPLLTEGEEMKLAASIQSSLREQAEAARLIPAVLRLTASLPRLSSEVITARCREADRAWASFKDGVMSAAEYRGFLAGSAALLQHLVAPGQIAQGYALREQSIELARTIGAEARMILDGAAGMQPSSHAAVREQWEKQHQLPLELAAEVGGRIEAARERVRGDRDRLWAANLRFVVALAGEQRGWGATRAELISLGNEGLREAVERFEGERGNRFATYAAFWVRQAMRRGVQEEGMIVRLPSRIHEQLGELGRGIRARSSQEMRPVAPDEVAAELGWSSEQRRKTLGAPRHVASLDAPRGRLDGSSSWVSCLQAREEGRSFSPEELEVVTRRIAQVLDPRQRTVVALLHGLRVEGMLPHPDVPAGEPQTLQTIGTLFNLTRERVRQIEIEARAVVTHALVVEYAGSRAVREAERALLPGQQLLIFAGLEPGCPPLRTLLDDPHVKLLYVDGPYARRDPEQRVIRLFQDALERLAEQVVVDALSPAGQDQLLSRLTRAEERFVFEEYWLGAYPGAEELLAERQGAVIRAGIKPTTAALRTILSVLRERELSPRYASFLREQGR